MQGFFFFFFFFFEGGERGFLPRLPPLLSFFDERETSFLPPCRDKGRGYFFHESPLLRNFPL